MTPLTPTTAARASLCGQVIAKWPRESFYLATKMPLWQCGSLEEAQHIFEEQLRRLGVEYIDFYLLHSLHKARYEKAKAMGLVDWLWQQKAARTHPELWVFLP